MPTLKSNNISKRKAGFPRSSIKIGSANIGDNAPTYVIAEAGVNHDGQISIAKELIHAAHEAKADAVKFQVFSADRLVTRNASTATYQQKANQASNQFEMLRRLELTHEEFAELYAYCGYRGIEFLATPFSLDDLKFLVAMGVRAIKLASSDIVNQQLLEAAAIPDLPIIASTGAAELSEISEAMDIFEKNGADQLALMHCVSAYPTPDEQANLRAITTLAKTFNCISGFSDHTQSLSIGGYARAAGASIIEKHLTLDQRRSGPDHAFSLTADQMAEYILNIRQADTLMGSGKIVAEQCENDVRTHSRGSIVTLRDIRGGETISRDMLTVKRPGTGIAPRWFDDVLGLVATRDIPADTPMDWDLLS
jgi:sialic acid synthase SpsE